MSRLKGRHRKSRVGKRAVTIAGRKTSVSLEDAFWQALKEIASEHDMTPSELVADIKSERRHANLSSAIRLFVLDFYQQMAPITSRIRRALARPSAKRASVVARVVSIEASPLRSGGYQGPRPTDRHCSDLG